MAELAPALFHGYDSDWLWYVPGHDPADLVYCDDPDALHWEPLWMYPTRASSLDESERPEGFDTLTRDEHGRFQSTYLWMECRGTTPGAHPFMGVRYKTGEKQ